MKRPTAVRASWLLAALLAAPALAAEQSRITGLQVQVEAGEPTKVTVQGNARLPDNAVINVSLKNETTDIQGKRWKLLDMKRVSVKNEAFETVFTPAVLPFGVCQVEVACDKDRQYPGVKIPDAGGSLKAESSFKVDFTDDYAAPALALADALRDFEALNTELEGARKQYAGKAADFEAFQAGWTQKLSALSGRFAGGQEDPLYPHARAMLSGISSKLGLFRELHLSEIKGEKNQTQQDHPNWFEPPVPDDLAQARRTLAAEFAFNTGRKVVDFGYDKATDLLKQLKGSRPGAAREWDSFRKRFGKDLEDGKAGYDKLAAGPLRQELASVASDVPALVQAGQEVLEAIDQEAAGKGAAGLEKAKKALTAAYLALRGKLDALNKPAPPAGK